MFTHLDGNGSLNMVDVTEKSDTVRIAKASGEIFIPSRILELIKENKIKKGNVLEAARLAGIMAAKRTSDLIPLCHPLFITSSHITFDIKEESIVIECEVKTTGKTGVEMEALTAASIAALTVYDMCKAVDKNMVIDGCKLLEKRGGKSDYHSV